MKKTFLRTVPENETTDLLNVYEMKVTLESLATQIAGNNDILKEDSTLYKKLVEDYREALREYEGFWGRYNEEYKDLLDNENKQLSIEFSTGDLYLIETV